MCTVTVRDKREKRTVPFSALRVGEACMFDEQPHIVTRSATVSTVGEAMNVRRFGLKTVMPTERVEPISLDITILPPDEEVWLRKSCVGEDTSGYAGLGCRIVPSCVLLEGHSGSCCGSYI